MTRRRTRPCRMPAANYRKLCPIVGALLISLGGCNPAQNLAFEETFERVYTIEPTTNITIHNGDGAVLVYGSNTSEMQVHAIKRAYLRSRLTQIAIDVSAKPGSVSITPNFLLNPGGVCLIGPGPSTTPSCFLQRLIYRNCAWLRARLSWTECADQACMPR